MNERILKLAEMHGFVNEHMTPGEKSDALKKYEKFAQLIVQECVEQLRYTVLDTQELRRDKSTDYQVGWEDGMFDAEEMIKEHFYGVEE
jgi:hypothetical protein